MGPESILKERLVPQTFFYVGFLLTKPQKSYLVKAMSFGI